ncbi:alpha-1,2-fucosyltransferase [Pedobacter frigoris]|uniref:Alpha-1,2-fucosyltransferase n=1 Tax=Pedobacter frigoris TaxID=2571272 RepID=A0A4U1CCI8_9SPHI|nr:alpha-1,2-fucosyltransferase [Pedobacter frigoris]TKC02910.1 alpha-1,2-fucosyltransferase [Pedobacter frigoris]
MKIVRFLGGLGNQMFQYAFYKALQKRFPNVKADLQGFHDYGLHNGFELEDIFDIHVSEASLFKSKLYQVQHKKWIYRKLRRIMNLKKAYQEESNLFGFDPQVLTNPKPAYYWGYWQNIAYFQDISKALKTDFEFKNPLDDKNQQALNRIQNSNSVSIHIRRGDYLTDPLLGGLCSLKYYQSAIAYIQSKVDSPRYFIFSNDIAWCQENLKITNCEFISWNNNSSSYIDMQLMSQCKHNIIANSSFSWWGAWLNQNQNNIVICPKKWVNDVNLDTSGLIPQTWLSI